MSARGVAVCFAAACALSPAVARAQATTDAEPTIAPVPSSTATWAPAAPVAPAPIGVRQPHFRVDVVADGATLVVSLGVALMLEAIISTGEITPQPIRRGFDRKDLLFIDRGSIFLEENKEAGPLSTAGLGLAVGYAALDSVLTGYREGEARSAMIDATIYSESIAIAYAFTNITKVAVRRPRPRAYVEAIRNPDRPTDEGSTDQALSFFSGHAAITASVAATATYLAFVRSPGTARPWLTLAVGTLLTAYVSMERVRASAHFPSDVIVGALAGAGVGLLVPYVHRINDGRSSGVYFGAAPTRDGGVATVSGTF